MNGASETITATSPERAAAGHAPNDVCQALRSAAAEHANTAGFYRKAFDLIVASFDAPCGAIRVNLQSGVVEDHAFRAAGDPEPWKKLCRGLMLRVSDDGVPRARMVWSLEAEGRFAVLAMPLGEACPQVGGSLALVVPCGHPELAESRLRELRAVVTLMDTLAARLRAPSGTPAGPTEQHALTAAARTGAFETVHEFAFSIVNSLKNKFGFEQVCLGRARHGRVRMLAMSGFDNLYPRSPGTRQIEQAMEECVDAGEIICFQFDANWAGRPVSTGHRLHRAWHHATGNAAVASIPLMFREQCVAVLSLRNPSGRPFQRGQLEKIEEMVGALVPGLRLLERAERSLRRHLSDAVVGTWRALLSPGAWGRKVALLGALAAGLWFVFGTQRYVVTVPCEVVPAEVRHISAPFEGILAAAKVEPGAIVAAGDELARLDTTDLEVERAQWEAERRIAQLDLARALAAKDVAGAGQAQARIAIADNELELVAWKFQRAVLRAPADGIVLDGDLAPRVGDVVERGEPLVRFAPRREWRVRIDAPESVVVHLRPGQAGWFATRARPDRPEPLVVEQVSGSSSVMGGRNVYRVKASVRDVPPQWVRSGMRGVARIDTGRRPVWWIWLHRIIDRTRLQLWKL